MHQLPYVANNPQSHVPCKYIYSCMWFKHTSMYIKYYIIAYTQYHTLGLQHTKPDPRFTSNHGHLFGLSATFVTLFGVISGSLA